MAITCYNCFQETNRGGPCPHCGYDAAKDAGKYPLALNPGSILNGRYVVGRVLGQGGFGITYVCSDHRTGERLALKEYLPGEFAGRSQGGASVEKFSGERGESFEYGKEQFLAEARTLAEFIGNSHIVRIHSYFEENGTAYFAMEYVEGVSLDRYMSSHGGRLTPDAANTLLLPVMDALGWVHSKGIVHRDIAPDNIIVTAADETAKLIDFGAARFSMGEKSRSLDVILKHGFAPKEQYTRHGRQGAFTDVYAMTATYYYAITGRIPPDAIERTGEDTLKSPSEYGVSISRSLEDVLKTGLAISAQNRYGSMAELKSAIENAMSDEIVKTDVISEEEPADIPNEPEPQTESGETVIPKSTGAMGVDITFTQQGDAPETVHHRTAGDEKKTGLIKKLAPIAAALAVAAVAVAVLVTAGRNKPEQNTAGTDISAEAAGSAKTEAADSPVNADTAPDEILNVIKAGAESGDAESLCRLGFIYENGYDYLDENCQKQLISNWELDRNKSVEYYKAAAEQGNTDAMFHLGWIYGELKKFQEAQELYEKAAELGQTNAMYCLARMYDSGNGIEKSSAKADKWYNAYLTALEAEESPDFDDFQALINIYNNGYGVEKNKTKAAEYQNQAVLKLEEQATQYGNIRACDILGDIYRSDTYFPAIEKDMAKALEWETKAAEQGDAVALYDLGISFMRWSNATVIADEEAGREYMLQSAEAGYHYGFTGLADPYTFGKLTDEQKERLVEVCKRFADAGDPEAMHSLSEIYSNQSFAGKDAELAESYFMQAADIYKTEYAKGNEILISGDVFYTVCGELGDMYNETYNHTGFEDNDEALVWYQRAYDTGLNDDYQATAAAYGAAYALSKTDKEEALEWVKKGLQSMIDKNNNNYLSGFDSLLSTLNPCKGYSYSNNPEKYAGYGSYVEAMKLYEKALKLSQSADE